MKPIKIIGAKQNNLKDISLEIPKHQLTVFTGRSGSGKSSLVFNTIAAESERLLNETYSTYIQNQLNHYDKPVVDRIENLPVSMVIGQDRIGGNSRSTVGTISDIYSGVRLLWSRIGQPFVGYSMDFSFNNTNGMCKTCDGLGYVEDIDLNELLHFDRSLNEDAIKFPSFAPNTWRGKRYLNTGLFDNDKKLKDYSKEEMDTLLYQEPIKLKNPPSNWPKTAKYEGLIYRFRRSFLINDTFEKKKFIKDVNRIVTKQVCPDCEGKRLNDKILSCKIDGLNIAEFCDLTVDDEIKFLNKINDDKAQYIIEPLVKQLEALKRIGLGYLTLSRETTTLSGGESQRIKLIRHLNSPLTDLVYIIDEPSIGLHPEDIENINQIMLSIRDKGNTVLVVEHDPDVIKIADYCVDIGPGSGKRGGEIIFTGKYNELLKSNSPTGKALSQPHAFKEEVRVSNDYIALKNITKNNLKDVSVNIPEHVLTAVTGVAGSGKSTLIQTGLREREDVVYIDQKPVHATNRSNLLTYLDIFDDIRGYYSKETGLKKGMFSYNSEGACPNCNGKGVIKTELAFMSDFVQQCEVCHGKRYRPEVLEAKVKGYSIADMLELSVEEAIDFFQIDNVNQVLKSVKRTGLDYMTLGQSLDTLSGGESQRVKLSRYINEGVKDKIFIFDEPTTGLHEADIDNLKRIFDYLIDEDNTVIVIEHNLTMMTYADWIIDIGPRAGLGGGKVLYSGVPKEIVHEETSLTGKHLLKYIDDSN
ncbi:MULTISPECIES: ATP-binding cassette domain-containing protein [Staphylococcaceae]|uniref:Excinuclease ABC subunit UvrA n=1 Tax=Macrococcus psychrotolerans TaxID=3039389 RepID=A0AAT9P461_9STAP|nr:MULTISPECIES: excinuclease ABC subunit UvrA [Macrococcus]QYA32909.1 excinuclease ABC subunit UvrA [Macrococcus sp. 19Msa1099]QYA37720.1 excinuclease ABC subunit UvrA [Macrococcus caseolyticus]QYA76427.1 excinuclease ABC subunit UvrA [Macrococcus caseolyticus]